jgi:hypothetical protein
MGGAPVAPIKRNSIKKKYEKERSHPDIDKQERLAAKEAKYADVYMD